MNPWTWKQEQTLWHPDSPGERVTVVRLLPWWRRSKFATLSEVIRLRKRQLRATDTEEEK